MMQITQKTKVLYLSYDGMTDPLGQSQVLSYLKELSKNELSFHVISFEKKEVFENRKQIVADFIKGHDVTWHPLSYTKKPPVLSSMYDIWQAKKLAKKLQKEHDFKIVHVRGYMLAGLAIKLKARFGLKFIFDMRGWWPDEKKESGNWSSPIFGPVYRYFKKQEIQFFKQSDVAISLTHVGKEEIVNKKLKPADQVVIIPTCVNFEVFKPFDATIREQKRKMLGIPLESRVYLYSGSVGANYRTDLVLQFFKYLLEIEPNSFFVFLSHSDHSIIDLEIQKSGLAANKIKLVSSEYNQVGDNLMVADVGIIMYNLGFSVIGRSPTKLGEYWASGLKCLSAKKIGDLEAIINRFPNSGYLIDNLEDELQYKTGVENVNAMNCSKEQLRTYAKEYFDLENGVEKYLEMYKNLLKS